jgi:hypothetical protein
LKKLNKFIILSTVMLNYCRQEVGCASGDTDVYAVAVSASHKNAGDPEINSG